MKKLIYGAVIALAMGVVSCDKAGDNGAKFFSQEATDSLLISLGEIAGYNLNGQITNAMLQDSTISKEQFLKGIQYAMACDTTDAYMNGIMTGLQIQRQLKQYRAMGLNVNPSTLLGSFKDAFMDSVPSQITMSMVDAKFRKWSDSLNIAQQEYELAKLKDSPEAKENAEKGATYIKAMKAQNDSVQISASGLGYKIENPGEGEKATPESRVVLKYTLKNTNGQVLDQNAGVPMYLANTVPGFKEGVSMLAKGGKATLYVPGELGYGVQVPNRLPIGLNELLIFDVEVIDIPTVDAAQMPVQVR